MNEDILINLGEVSKETKGAIGGQHESEFVPDLRKE
jgi:hypothetical protein